MTEDSARPGPSWATFDRDAVRALAPDAIDAFRGLLSVVGTAYDPVTLELIRRRIGMLLSLPDDVVPELATPRPDQVADLAAWPASPAYTTVQRATMEFAEQFVMDVAAVTGEDRRRLSEAAGSGTFPLVQALYVLDHVARLSGVVRQLFGASPLDVAITDGSGDLWAAMEHMMAAVITIRGLDPVAAELVRLRVARAHNCRLCQSRRRAGAVTDGAALLENPDAVHAPGVADHQRAALLLTDAILLSPGAISAEVADEVRAHLTPDQALEVAMLVAHNAANKIAVALGADAPVVSEGVEFFEVDASGHYSYGLPSPV